MLVIKRRYWIFIPLTILLLLALTPQLLRADSPEQDELQAIWERVRQAGAYNFSTELEQTLTPESTAVNAGREVKETRLLMEGQADMAAETMHMTLWSGSGSVLAPETGVQFKVEDGRSYTRQGGGHWEETEDFTTMVAPGGDFMGYVQAAENVVRHEPEWRATIGEDYLVTRYTFDINGRKFAEYVREQMQQQEGLPPGIEVQLPQAYLNMNGQGELLVGAGGMPLRQQFDLQFPETDGYHTSAIVTTDFSDFRAVPVLSTATAVGKSVGEAAQGMTPVVITLIVLLSMALFVRYRNSKQVYAYVAIIVIASMLLSPLLTSMRVYAYQGEQSARQAEQEAQRAEQESREEQQALLLSSSFDPNTDPLQQAHQPQREDGIAATASATSTSSKYADPLCESDPSGDADGDTLTNLQECLLGTLPGAKDSDGDLVDDNVEVAGIALTYNGITTTWYTDPLSMDSNNDSIADGKEWHLDANNDGKPDDTDGDGVPDMWDQDNDGDGVPDVEDLSDYATTKGTTSFDGDKPMQLLVDDLIYNSQAQASDQALVKVEFQLSPTDAEHLWYSHNVLDWPDNDRQGQIQDADGKSFFDVDPTLDPTPNDWGDMRLVPMLEIEISGPPDNLPSDEILKQFGISVQQTTASTKVAYVPLQLVSDQHGDKNVAFYGRMFYRTASSWGNAHQVRLVWIVQALVDQCKTFKNGICSEYKTMNDLQVVQTYDDEWFLTGLHVTEEHGADMAIIYEDPAVTDKTSAGSAYDKPFYMDTLFGLLYGLDNSYLAGSDCDTTKPDGTCSGNGQRDVTVASIATDFNHSSNGLPITGGEENFKLPNVLTVERNQYDALDLGIQQTTITNTLSVLNTNFSSHWSAAEPITPTIMLAYDQTFRALNLDEMLGGNPNMSLSGSTLTASLPTSGDNKVVSQTVATVKWTPYAYDPASGWTTADMEAYWDAMNEHLGSSFTDYTDQDEARTYQTMSQLIYLSAFNAEQNVVVQDNKINFQVYQQSISTLGAKLTADAGKFIKQTASNYFKYSSTLKEAADLVNPATGETTGYAKAIPQFLWQKLSAGQEGAAGVAIAVTVLLLVVTAGIAEIEQHVAHNTDVGWKIAAGVSVGVLITAIVIIKPIMEVVKLVLFAVSADVSVGEAVLKILTADSSLLGASRAAGYVGLVISIGVSIGIFIYAVSNGHVKAGSIEFNELLAATIAAIIVALILFILSVSVVGTILVGLILVIDSILAAIGVKWSITGWLTKAITGWLYRYDPAAGVDVSTDLAISLKDPNAGFVNTNQITYKLPITSTLVFTDVNGVPDPDKQRDNTLIYELDAKSKDLSASKGQISADWTHGITNTVDILGVDYVSKSETLTFSTMPTATINLPGNLMLNTGYDLLGDNCWVFGIGCGDHWQSGSNSAPIGNGLAFDVFPATLKDFVDVDTWTSGQIRFPDVDGDGLLSFEAGGVDPNPTDWDSDNDGLADGYEAAIRAKTADQGGVNLNLLSPDSDGDLIGDGDEIRLGTNPGNADSDDDGIPDIEEVAYVVDIHGDPIFGGWDLPYAPNKTTRVWSDPLHADADGDGLSDLFERTQDTCPTCLPWQDPKNPLVYNPKVWNESPVPLYFTDDTARGYVVPGASLVYTTTTANNLSSGQSLVGDLSLDLPPTFSGGPLAAGVDIPSGGQQSLVSELTAADATQPISGTLTGHMQLTDLGSVVWSWDAVSSEMDDSLAGSILSLKAASVQGWAAPYLLVTQEMPSPTDPSFVIVGYLASAAGRIVDSRVLHRSGKGESPNGMPDVACTDDGDCLIVFSTWLGATYPIKSILLRQQLASTGAQTLWTDSIQPSWPVVGSNPSGANEGFMVSWNTNADNKWQGLALPILDNGVAPANSNHIDAGGNIVLVSNPAQIFDTSTPTNIAGITWGGAHYQAFSPGTNGLNIALLDPLSGKPTPGGKVLSGYGYANAVYDQVSKQTLLLHQQQGNEQGLFATILPPDLSPGATTTLAQQIPNVAPLCADPKNGGWLAAWPKENSKVINYQAIGPSGSVRGAVHTIATTSDEPFLALACEYPRPILELHFEEKQGAHLFADTSGLGNTATCISCPDAGQQGRFGNGLFFQATNKEFLTVPSGSIDHIHQSVSFSAWVKPGWTANSMGYNPAILALRDSSNTAYSLHIRDDYSALDLFNGSAVSSMSYNFTPEVMVHVAVVMENDSWTAYIDGEAVGTKTVSLGSTTNLPFHIGSSTGNGEFFTGIIDEVVVWPRALSSNEIGDAFNAATTIYDLDEVAGSVAMIDSSNNGFNASCSEANGTCPTMGVAGKADTAAQFDGVNDFLVIEPISQTVAVHGYTFDTADSALHFEKSTEDSDLDIINFDDATGLDNYAQCFEFSCPTASAVGHEGKGVHFDGASKQNLNLRDSLSLDHTAFTIAAWAKRDSTGKAMAILSQGGVASTNQWLSFGFRDNDKFTCAFYADDLDSTAAYTDTDWHHWVCSYDSLNNVRNLYRDGQLIATDQPSKNGLEVSGWDIFIGMNAATTWLFSGTIDDVGIWRRFLTTEEVGKLYKDGLDLYTNAFDGWSQKRIEQVHTSSDRSLGTFVPYANTALGFFDNEQGSEPVLTLDGLPIHDTIDVKFDIKTIGRWDGTDTANGPDNWHWGYDGLEAFLTSFVWLGQEVQDYTGYYQAYPDSANKFSGEVANPPFSHMTNLFQLFGQGLNGQSYALDGTGDHIKDSIELYFQLDSKGYQPGFEEQFALDNVVVTIKRENTTIPLADRSFTLSAWAKHDNPGQPGAILSQGEVATNQGLVFGFRNDNFTCAFWGDDLNVQIANDDSNWHHWACTYDAGTTTRTIYRDGVQIAQDSASGNYTGLGATYIGRIFNGEWPFKGTIDEVGIWTESLTAGDIAVLYSKVKAQDESIIHALLPNASPGATSGATSLDLENLELRETATQLGTVFGSTSRTLTIDTDNPVICPNNTDGSKSCPPADQYVNAASTLAISGLAADPTSFIETVEVDVGGWSSSGVEGTESWSYNWDISALGEGKKTLPVRATDAVGHVSGTENVTVIVDRTPPSTTFDPINGVQRPRQALDGHWMVSLSGKVNEPNAGGKAGSGLVSVELLFTGDGDLAGQQWQEATLSGSNWSIDYILPAFGESGQSMADPSGDYTVSLRATDQVGNTTTPANYITETLSVDSTAPALSLTYPVSTTSVISTTLTLTGKASDDHAAVGSVQVNFTPAEQLDALTGTALHLPFDENQFTEYFVDQSGSGHAAVCSGAQCPTFGQSGQRDRAVALDGTDDYLIAPFLFDPSRTEFSAAIWFNAGNVDSSFMALIEQVPGYAFLGLLNGNVLFAAPSGYTLSSEPVIQANQWYHSALTHDGVTLRLYLNGELVDSVDDTPNASTAAVHIGVDGDGSDGFFNGLLDEVTMYDRVLAGYEVANLYAYGSGTWADASLDGSSWTYTIPEGDNGLEGIYQINLRSKDTLGNVTALGHQRQWRGEIDTRPPAVTYSAAPSTNGGTTTTSYNCTATDYNLVEGSSCLPVAPATLPQFRNSDMTMTTYDQVDAWYSATISDTTRLYNMDATRTYTGTQDTTGSVTTCDKYNRCTTVAPAVKLDAVDTTPTLATEVLDPSSGTVLTTLDPVTVEGFAYAEAYLKELLVTINNTPAYDHSWEWGTETENQWLFDWTPPAEGIYNFMPRVTDWHGEGPPPMPLTTYMPLVFAADPLAGEAADTDVSQTTSATTDSSGATSPSTTHTGNVTTLYVDTEPPAITIDPLLLNANDLIGGRTVYVTGTASDTVRVHRVEVSINSGPWQRAGLAADGHWHYPWFLHQEVDGEIFDIRARATDLAGRTTTATEDVVVDITAPEHDQITLSYVNTDGQTHDVSPGSTLRDAVALQVSWTAGSDGHGIASYEASFSNDRTPPPPGPPHFIPYPGPDTHEQDPASEAQTWYAHVSIIDIADNSRTETVGPIHVDAPLTPDLVGNLRYRGWTDAECTIQGVDRRLAQRHPGVFGNEIQSMFASWDENALRLSWNGAHWQHHGDLFFYLDTHIGGAQQLFNPYPDDNTIIYLPGNTPQTPTNGGMRQLAALESVTTQQAMRADFMVWVEDEKQATFWRWNGSSWQNEGTLDEESFRLSADIEASDTDILLPFEKLGILDPSTATLGLLAVASEEDSLELWATMPDRNPLNSARLLDGFADQDEETTLALSRAYYWEGLGNGHCANGRLNSDGSGPAGGAYADSDLQMTLSASPVGTIYHFMGEGLSPWWTLLFGYENVPYVPSLLLDHRDTNHPPLGPGETISYTINYVNHGSEAATGVQLDLQSWLSLELPNHVVDLGDIPPGGSGSYTFSGAVDVSGQGQVAYNECRLNFPPQICDRTKEWAALDVYVYDDQSPRDPVAGPWSSAPLEWLWSDHPVDSSPPSAVGISSPTSVIPAGEVTIRGFAHDQSAVPLITLQARVGGTVSSIDCPQGATTQNGNWTCNWDPGAVTDGEIVDLQVRATDEFGHTSEWSAWISLTVDSSPPTITVNPGVDGETLGAGTHALSGMLSNSQSGGEVRLCVEDELPCQIVPVDPQTGRWSTHLPSPDAGAPDALSVTLKLYGADAAGNSTVDPVTISYLLDTVHPELEVTTVVEEVDENTSGPVLAGSASDGSAFDVYVELRPPSGSNERYQAGVTDGEWSFNHTFSEIGTYRAWVQAVDIAGNRRTNGPFLITVTSP